MKTNIQCTHGVVGLSHKAWGTQSAPEHVKTNTTFGYFRYRAATSWLANLTYVIL